MVVQVMSGGIRINRAGFIPSIETQNVYEQAWSAFVRRLLESMWCFGFAASVSAPDDRLGTMPLVLDLELLRVGVSSDYMGRRTYVFYEENFAHGVNGHSALAYQPIPNVVVYEYTPPLPDGSLNSCITRILPYYNQMLIATEADLRVILSNSAPSLWTQRQSADRAGKPDLSNKNKGQDGSMRAAGVEPQNGRGGGGGGGGGVAPHQPDPIMPVQVMASSRDDTRPSRMLARMPQLDEGTRVIKLPDGQEGHAFASAPEPVFLPHYVEKFEQAVANAFKVPVALFSADKLMRRDRTSHAQRLDAEMVVFEQNARALQHRILDIINDASERIYGPQFREDALILALENPEYIAIANLKPQVSWVFETLVDPLVIEKLYYEGTLERTAYLAYTARHYGIDPVCFTSTPGLSLLELNGLDPPDEGPDTAKNAAGSAKKKRKK
jgi:hypothetical protein